MTPLIYDIIVLLIYVAIGILFLLAAYKKLPNQIQEAFDTILPWSRRIPIILGVVMLLNAANYSYGAFFSV